MAKKCVKSSRQYRKNHYLDQKLCYGRQKLVVLQQRIPKACMWVIVETFTFTLNPIVLIYVMNQIKGPQLLTYALITSITCIMNMEPNLLYLFNEPEISNPFEVEILLLHINMQLEVINSIKHFLDFLRSFDAHLVHNMMARLCVLWETQWDVGMQFGFTFKHDIKIVIPLVMVCIN